MKVNINLAEGTAFLNTISLHVERINALGMVEGFYTENDQKKLNYVTILTNTKNGDHLKKSFKTTPKLITNHTTLYNPKYTESNVKLSKDPKKYEIPLKYVAVLDTIYHISNTEELWKEICISGLFDIWKYTSPHDSLKDLNDKNKDRLDPQILLIRVYEIEKLFNKKSITWGRRYYKTPTEEIRLKRPILPKSDFISLKVHLEKILKETNSLKDQSEKCIDTCSINY